MVRALLLLLCLSGCASSDPDDLQNAMCSERHFSPYRSYPACLYVVYVHEKIQARVPPPSKRPPTLSGTVEVGFVIRQDGSVTGLRILQSSGLSYVDRYASAIVALSGPFEPPSDYTGKTDRFTVNITFNKPAGL